MTRDTITALPDPNGFSADPFTDLIRSGARQLIEQALEAELAALLAQFSNETTPAGHAHIVRHGQLPEREVMTGIGPVPVKVPRVRDRGQQAEKVRFTSSILPPYLHKAKSVE
ncbi:MAG: IS256 family transposase, partial [Tateyamaria sp.]|nr:IS256 family transposase [Tateyamaria sp.]